MSVLTLLIFIPIAGALLIWLPWIAKEFARFLALGLSMIVLYLAINTIMSIDPSLGVQMISKTDWIPNYGISFHIGADLFSSILSLIIALLGFLAIYFSQNQSSKGMMIGLMLAQGGATGVVFSLDLILFYLFWELMLIPIFFMIGMYGSGERIKTAFELTLYTIFGSMAMLFSILMLGVSYFDHYGIFSFDLCLLSALIAKTGISPWVAFGFLIAFLVKLPLLGFHGWLKKAYEDSPALTLLILSSVMAKLGIFGLLRFGMTLFGETIHAVSPYLVALSLFGMVYFGIAAIRQERLRTLLAYSSASHMSLITAGLFFMNPYSVSGMVYLIISHAIGSAGMFIILDRIESSARLDTIGRFSGIIHTAPRLGVLFALFALSLVGIPLSGGFVAELLIIFGAFEYSLVTGFFTALTLLIAMTFMLWLMKQMLFGPPNDAAMQIRDFTFTQTITVGILVIILFILGVYPEPMLTSINHAIVALGVCK